LTSWSGWRSGWPSLLQPWHLLSRAASDRTLLEHDSPGAGELAELGRAGVQVVLDDFGTGYSSFGHLRQLPVAGLKIDRSFVLALPDDRDAATIVRAILAMAGELGLGVTAEGVETPEQLAFLTDLGCPQVQGYLLGRPALAATAQV
jgi:EAL domain-containing protein (putative c-di-GMP-specific phosphodiesterase class I)